MTPLIKNNLHTITQLFRKYNTERAFLFGSAAKGNFNEDSDIDFLFSFPQSMDYEVYADNYFCLLYELQDLLKRDVELVAEKTLKNPFLIESIEESKIQLI
jgi:uncharacterized protein